MMHRSHYPLPLYASILYQMYDHADLYNVQNNTDQTQLFINNCKRFIKLTVKRPVMLSARLGIRLMSKSTETPGMGDYADYTKHSSW